MNYELRSPMNKSLSITEQVFMNRGFIHEEDILHYLNTDKNDILNPSLIDRIADGAKMLIKHIAANDKVFIQIDSDCDGYTSAACLINYLNCLFPSFTQNNIIYRVQDGKEHGIKIKNIPSGIKLVICPDSSSNDYDEHKMLAEMGIDVLVIDHHEAEKISEYACVINNQLCDYPTKSLSGVGMVYKFCCFLDSLLGKSYADDFLDLVAVGEIGDMVDLRDFEVKQIISQGLDHIHNPHIKARCQSNAFSIGDTLTPFGVSFYVAPFINAINRSGTFEEKMLVFESMLEFKAYEQVPSTKRGCQGQTETRVEQAIRTSNNVKNRQQKAEENSRDILETLIDDNNLLANKILIITIDAENAIDSNLTGLVANQLANIYMRPTLILNETFHDNEYWWEGSGRNFANSPLLNFRKFLADSNFFEYAQGHESAFGAGIRASKLKDFINYSNTELASFEFFPKYLIDFEFERNDSLNINNTILELGNLKKHWGQGVEEPLILIKNINITADNIVQYEKGPTLKITLPGDEGIELIKFRSSKEEYEELCSSFGCVTINVIGTCDINSYRGFTKPQITIKDYEIIGKQAYYF